MDRPDTTKTNSRPTVILFDVYGTLLDMGEVRSRINRLLGSKRAFGLWFHTLLQYSWMDNSTGQYHDFALLADTAMETIAKKLGEQLDASDREIVLRLMRQLPVHEDVQMGLSSLRDQGYRLATLTNESIATITERMELTGLISYFEGLLSTETVKRHKPATETYQWAVQSLGVPASEVLMVSMHGWDVAGALYAGMPAALILRYSQSPYPLAPQPTYMASNLVTLAEALDNAQVI